MLNWLLRFLLCAFVLCVVLYVVKLLLAQVHLPEPVGTIALLILGVMALIAVVRYLGLPPGTPPGAV